MRHTIPAAAALLLLSTSSITPAIPGPPGVTMIYVDRNVAAPGDGSSWTDAFEYLQKGLAAAALESSDVEIWVADGTYRPDQGIAPGNQ